MIRCRMCNEEYLRDELDELREMGEEYYWDGRCLICPDCWDSLQRQSPETQVKRLLEVQDGRE